MHLRVFVGREDVDEARRFRGKRDSKGGAVYEGKDVTERGGERDKRRPGILS